MGLKQRTNIQFLSIDYAHVFPLSLWAASCAQAYRCIIWPGATLIKEVVQYPFSFRSQETLKEYKIHPVRLSPSFKTTFSSQRSSYILVVIEKRINLFCIAAYNI